MSTEPTETGGQLRDPLLPATGDDGPPAAPGRCAWLCCFFAASTPPPAQRASRAVPTPWTCSGCGSTIAEGTEYRECTCLARYHLDCAVGVCTAASHGSRPPIALRYTAALTRPRQGATAPPDGRTPTAATGLGASEPDTPPLPDSPPSQIREEKMQRLLEDHSPGQRRDPDNDLQEDSVSYEGGSDEEYPEEKSRSYTEPDNGLHDGFSEQTRIPEEKAITPEEKRGGPAEGLLRTCLVCTTNIIARQLSEGNVRRCPREFDPDSPYAHTNPFTHKAGTPLFSILDGEEVPIMDGQRQDVCDGGNCPTCNAELTDAHTVRSFTQEIGTRPPLKAIVLMKGYSKSLVVAPGGQSLCFAGAAATACQLLQLPKDLAGLGAMMHRSAFATQTIGAEDGDALSAMYASAYVREYIAAAKKLTKWSLTSWHDVPAKQVWPKMPKTARTNLLGAWGSIVFRKTPGLPAVPVKSTPIKTIKEIGRAHV